MGRCWSSVQTSSCKMNKFSRNRLTDLEKELMVTSGEECGGGIDWEFGIDMYTLLQYI